MSRRKAVSTCTCTTASTDLDRTLRAPDVVPSPEEVVELESCEVRGTGAVVVRDAVAMTLSGVNEANVGEVAELGLGAAQNAARAALSRS